jgi:hypothetical protein
MVIKEFASEDAAALYLVAGDMLGHLELVQVWKGRLR